MKKIFLYTILLFSFWSSIEAATLNTPTDVKILYVDIFHNGKWTGWQTSGVIHKGDKVWFHIHAYANGDNISNLKSKLEDITKINFRQGNTHSVYAFVEAYNAEKITGEVKLTFADNIKLKAAGYRWAIKLKGAYPEKNEHFLDLPYNQTASSALSSNGAVLGDLEKDYRSNLLLFFKTDSYKEPVDGVCGVKKNNCLKGKFVDIKDSSDFYLWSCNGYYNGASANCKIKKIPINGICSNYKNKCKAGYFLDIKDSSKEYIWKCIGLNGGIAEVCKIDKLPVNGKCGNKLNFCSTGRFVDVKDDSAYKKWSCNGYYGGVSANCSIRKMCPCSLNETVVSSTNDIDKIKFNNKEIKENLEQKETPLVYRDDRILKNDNDCLVKGKKDSVLSIWWIILWIIYTLLIILISKKIFSK